MIIIECLSNTLPEFLSLGEQGVIMYLDPFQFNEPKI